MNTKFKKDFTEKDFKSIEKKIHSFLRNRMNYTNETPNADILLQRGANTFKQIESILGLAYTSSGIFAGLWICNVELYLDCNKHYKIEGFCMDENGFTYIWCNDANENEFFINI